MKTLILGLGNPILSDDGVGLRVAGELKDRLDQRKVTVVEILRSTSFPTRRASRTLKDRLDQQEVTVMETSMAGLSLLDLLAGYDGAIIIDAIRTAEGKPGQIYRLDPEKLDATIHAASPHDVNFATALELGKMVGLALPRQIVIFAIEVADVSTFSEECTPEVRQAIPVCVEMIAQELYGGSHA